VAYHFVPCDRDQPFLMPPSLLDWVPEDHVVWTILAAVEQMDLGARVRRDLDRTDARGGAAGLRCDRQGQETCGLSPNGQLFRAVGRSPPQPMTTRARMAYPVLLPWARSTPPPTV
jgi:hypothetical protein